MTQARERSIAHTALRAGRHVVIANSRGPQSLASLVEALGATVRVVPGDPRNVKITTPADLRTAELLLGG